MNKFNQGRLQATVNIFNEITEQLGQFVVDPPDTDFQHGYKDGLETLLFIINSLKTLQEKNG